MQYLVVCAVAFLVSVLTLFSGFGLGTVLMPFFALFFPVPIAIVATSVVHFVNNMFKLTLVGKWAKWGVVLSFGLPALLMALMGAFLLISVSHIKPLFSTSFYGIPITMTVLGVVVGSLVMLSSVFELVPGLAHLAIPAKYLPIGGALSGFLGGLTGNQGILRSAFLIKAGLNTEQFVGTSVVCSVIVDSARILVYGLALFTRQFVLIKGLASLVVAASLAAILGSLIASRFVRKVTFRKLQILVGIMLLILGSGLILGVGTQ